MEEKKNAEGKGGKYGEGIFLYRLVDRRTSKVLADLRIAVSDRFNQLNS